MSGSNVREAYTAGETLLPELAMVGRVRLRRARVPGLEAHVHEGIYEIFWIERGEVEWWVEDEMHRVSANHIFINRPGETHGSAGHSLRPCSYTWVQIVFPRSGLPGLDAAASRTIRSALDAIGRRSFPASRELRAAFDALVAIHRESGPLAVIAARAWLHLLLARLLAGHESRSADAGRSFAIRKAMRAVERDPAADHSVSALAELTGLGVSQFSSRFLDETGFTPATYVRRCRVELAKSLLRSGRGSISEIAHQTGFSSGQHFSSVFKQLEGVSPSDVRGTRSR